MKLTGSRLRVYLIIDYDIPEDLEVAIKQCAHTGMMYPHINGEKYDFLFEIKQFKEGFNSRFGYEIEDYCDCLEFPLDNFVRDYRSNFRIIKPGHKYYTCPYCKTLKKEKDDG